MKKKARKIQLSRETLSHLDTGSMTGLGNDYAVSQTDCTPECIDCKSWCVAAEQMICNYP